MEQLFSVRQARNGDYLLDAGLSESEVKALSACAEWTATHPLQRVKKGRRMEAICPMVSPSIAADAMHFTVDRIDDSGNLESIDELLLRNAKAFHRIDPGDDPRLRCLVVVIPGARGQRLLDATHPDREIKNELLRQGILVGEFFPSCPFATTFNPRLFALRSPAPMYVLRPFIEGDWRFICKVPAWQQTYRARFGEPPARLRHLGSPLWRLKEKFRWRIEALRRRFEPGFPASPSSPDEPTPD